YLIYNAIKNNVEHPRTSFNVLHLLAHLLDQHLQLHRRLGGVEGDGFRGQGVGFPVELLHQEVETPADGFSIVQYPADFTQMGVEAVQLLRHIGLLGEQGDLLLEALGVEIELQVRHPLPQFRPLALDDGGHQGANARGLDGYRGESLADEVGELCPFQGADLHQLVDGGDEQLTALLLEGIAVQLALLEDARVIEDVHGGYGGRPGHQLGNAEGCIDVLSRPGGVHHQA